MFELGKRQTLKVVKKTDFGIYLAVEGEEQERVLLPKKEVPEGTEAGDEIDVFLYKDSKDRLIATTREPKVHLGEVALLKVKEVSKIGAFLDWGLEKDLFLPFKQQTKRVFAGDECLAALYIDKSNRLAATMNVYNYLSKESPYKKNDKVEGIIYQESERFGVFVAVDGKYSGLIPRREAAGRYQIGSTITARVTAVKEDGKLDLSDREVAHVQIEEDAEAVMLAIEEFSGVLPFTDKANPEVIKRELGLTKNAFKRAVGHLLKQGKVEITEKAIRKIKD